MINVILNGAGAPLLLVHGLGGNSGSWNTILPALAEAREVIAIDLPGHGATPAAADSGTFAGLTDSVEAFIEAQDLNGVDIAGSSLGGRIALELARRGKVGATVALDPGGFWRGWERTYFRTTLSASIRLIRSLAPALPTLCRPPATRSMLLAQLSARPWALDADTVAAELQSIAATPTFDALLRDLAVGAEQQGPAVAPRDHRLGPAGPALPAAAGGPRAGGLPVVEAPLVPQLRPFPDMGPAGGDGPPHPGGNRRGPRLKTRRPRAQARPSRPPDALRPRSAPADRK